MIADESPEVRAAAISALANILNERVTDIIRPYLKDADPRIVTTAAGVLGRSGDEEDVAASVAILTRLASDTRESAAEARKDVAVAIRQIPDPRFRQLLIPLLYDSHPEVAAEAMRSVRALGASDPLFVPTLVSLLRHEAESSARDAWSGHGEGVLNTLAYLLLNRARHLGAAPHPATIAPFRRRSRSTS
jgi:HEAT repeat protein